MQIVIVDDDDFALSVLEATVTRMGYTATLASDGRQALDILSQGEIRLVITDWDMPEMNGIDLCRAIRRDDLSGYVYVIMLTGREGAKQRMEGLCAGADDFLNKPLDPEELLVCLKTAERILSLETRDVALFALAKLAESRDPETGAHVERVQGYTRLIAKNLSTEVKAYYGVDDAYIRLIYQTSPLHDLGKVSTPDSVLLKPGKLTEDEFAIIKTHTVVGAQTLDAALRRFPNAQFLKMAQQIAATHHEKFDGSGYPLGLVGEQIPLCGRIVAVADVYDALTSRRVYKEAISHEQAKAIIIRDRGSHFDPEVVNAFLRAEAQILKVRELLSDSAVSNTVQMPIVVPTAEAPRGASACKILIAEDDPIVRAKLCSLLAATGETIFETADGEQAIAAFDQHRPQVIISDWVMPGKDGAELCLHVRTRATSQPAHFIMLTSHSDKGRLLDAYRAGVDDFVSKPFDPEELLARVRAGIRAAKLHEELVRKATGSQALNAQLATLNSQLERLSITDELTGLFNRRHAMQRLEEQWNLVQRYHKALTVATIDIDYFKQINDTYGHDAGDTILRRISGLLRDFTRGTDVLCRVGGDEFLIIFPSQTSEEAAVCAERFRAAVVEHKFNNNGVSLSASVSIGIGTRLPEMGQFADLLKAADDALYDAKRAGRKCVRIHQRTELPPAPAAVAPPAPNSQAPATAPAPLPIMAAPAGLDLAAIIKRCGGDSGFASALLSRFQSQAGGEVSKIQQAFDSGDADQLRRGAHSLKSMAAYVAADAASALAGQIETLAHEKRLANTAPLITKLRQEIDQTVTWIARNAVENPALSA